MTRMLFALSTLILTLGVALPGRAATVDSFIPYYVPFQSLQTDDICFMRLPLYTTLGTPVTRSTLASLAPTAILKDFPTSQYVNVNLAAPATPMVHTYVSDAVTDGGVWKYAMKLDVAALSASNGTETIAGRFATIRAVKLALLAIARNMDDISDGNYRLRVTFTGLPSQRRLTGTKLKATTAEPYSATSPLLIAYQTELINVEGSCPGELE